MQTEPLANEQKPNVKPNTRPIAYWPDGFWLRNTQEAELCDRVQAFGTMRHQITEVSMEVWEDAAAVENHVKTLCAGYSGSDTQGGEA